jgi:glycosyltransferase involved in cell wall biosynthesis
MYHADLIAGVVARLAGCKRVYWNVRHSTLEKGKTRRSTLLVAKVCAVLSRYVPAGIVFCAEASIRSHMALGYSCKLMTVIPNGYDLARFSPLPDARVSLRFCQAIEDDVFLVGMVARFDSQKDHENLLAALSKLRIPLDRWKAVLVGAGIDSDNTGLVQRLAELSLTKNVLLLGQRNDIPSIMSSLDVHILSSSTEGFPNVVAEAMACGVVCVVTDVGDAREIVGETGWVVEARRSDLLAGAIDEAFVQWQDPAIWKARKDMARARIQDRYDISGMIQRYHEVWER